LASELQFIGSAGFDFHELSGQRSDKPSERWSWYRYGNDTGRVGGSRRIIVCPAFHWRNVFNAVNNPDRGRIILVQDLVPDVPAWTGPLNAAFFKTLVRDSRIAGCYSPLLQNLFAEA